MNHGSLTVSLAIITVCPSRCKAKRSEEEQRRKFQVPETPSGLFGGATGFNGKCGGKLSPSFKEWMNRMAISLEMT